MKKLRLGPAMTSADRKKRQKLRRRKETRRDFSGIEQQVSVLAAASPPLQSSFHSKSLTGFPRHGSSGPLIAANVQTPSHFSMNNGDERQRSLVRDSRHVSQLRVDTY